MQIWFIKTLRYLYFRLFVTPFIWVILGLNVRRGELLPNKGPAIIVANHNSHLDTMVIMVLLRRLLPIVKPIAAADYFLKNKLCAWFVLHIVGIIPIHRQGGAKQALEKASEALHAGNIIILYPEGSRGEPERMQKMKKGIAHLARDFPDIPVVPICLSGLGKALPKGEGLLVPFFCDVYIGEALYGHRSPDVFMSSLETTFSKLHSEAKVQEWD